MKPKKELSPKEINDQRTLVAGEAIKAFVKASKMPQPFWFYEIKTLIVDLLANLFHLCHRRGLNIDEIIETAREHYNAEKLEESK